MPDDVTFDRPEDPSDVRQNPQASIGGKGPWRGPTYYGRSQLKPAPFGKLAVGGYIFLAGLSGATALISALLDASNGEAAAAPVRRGRYLSLLAPTIGAGLLVWDLHTPKRFYNMLRIAKSTSPMSIGVWILMGFSAFAGVSAVSQFLSDRVPGLRWLRGAARFTQMPAAIAGTGLATYTASLLSATSTPLWAAAPQVLAVRFGSSSVAAGASALSMGEPSPRLRRKLDSLTVAALATELAAIMGSQQTYECKGVADALDGSWGQVEKWGATRLGVIAPLAIHGLSLLMSRRRDANALGRPLPVALSVAASLATLAGSLTLRVSILGAGNESAMRPDISFRFSESQPASE
ncbi:MAG TPA: NrfD/PsrC family molybdoenzyme membrane anchor subunit [Acetobacteraceae bacterium]|jgi:formate-dependent nitrite reductase membrane component NrfD|nr:NrfD/PsrC family molybdoenzyme membrane anchor subunit [Acetobacteraceae bacterium]